MQQENMAVTAKREVPVFNELVEMDAINAAVSDVLTRLCERLHPVLLEPSLLKAVEQEPRKDETEHCLLYQKLHERRMQAELNLRGLQDLLSRIDL